MPINVTSFINRLTRCCCLSNSDTFDAETMMLENGAAGFCAENSSVSNNQIVGRCWFSADFFLLWIAGLSFDWFLLGPDSNNTLFWSLKKKGSALTKAWGRTEVSRVAFLPLLLSLLLCVRSGLRTAVFFFFFCFNSRTAKAATSSMQPERSSSGEPSEKDWVARKYLHSSQSSHHFFSVTET